jgi:hypothetical protein
MTQGKPIPKIPEGVLTQDQIDKINGGLGTCSASEIGEILGNLQTNYDQLISFTSYVIETVATSVNR